ALLGAEQRSFKGVRGCDAFDVLAGFQVCGSVAQEVCAAGIAGGAQLQGGVARPDFQAAVDMEMGFLKIATLRCLVGGAGVRPGPRLQAAEIAADSQYPEE